MAVLVALVCLGLLAPGCPGPQPKTTLRVGYIPISDCAQLYVAVDKGFFDRQGLAVHLEKMAGGARILEALGANSLEVGFSNVASLIMARSQGLGFVALTGGPYEDMAHKEHAVLVAQQSNIRNARDLGGKTIALNTRRNIDHLMLLGYLRKSKVDPKTVSFVEVPFPQMESVLRSGEVDAIAAIEPFVTFALEHGHVRVLEYNYVALRDHVQISTYVVREDWVASNRDLANRFGRAIAQATDYIREHQQETREIIARYTGLDRAQLGKMGLPGFVAQLDTTELHWMVESLYEEGFIQTRMATDALVAH